jgi:hypothetical protein
MPMNNRLLVPRQSYDPAAAAYIAAVQAADGQALEPGVKNAIDQFVRGCKADGTWTAIKSACFLAGPRTLAGALVPLVGAAPTNANFVGADYTRKTGLVGNATNKSLNTNRLTDADPQDNMHAAVWVSTAESGGFRCYMGAGGGGTTGSTLLATAASSTDLATQCRSGTSETGVGLASTGLIGLSRSAAAEYVRRAASGDTTLTRTSEASIAKAYRVFARISGSDVVGLYSAARIAWYSCGESLTLSLLDARLATYMAAIGAAIP